MMSGSNAGGHISLPVDSVAGIFMCEVQVYNQFSGYSYHSLHALHSLSVGEMCICVYVHVCEVDWLCRIECY